MRRIHIAPFGALLLSLYGAPLAAAPPAVESESSESGGEDDGVGWSVLPIFGFAPENSWILGAYVRRHFDSPGSAELAAEDKPKRSDVSVVALGTFKSQFALILSPTIYFDRGRWSSASVLGAARMPDEFYALGPDSREDSRERYDAFLAGFDTMLERKLVGGLHAGWGFEIISNTVLETEPGGTLAKGELLGTQGGEVFGVETAMLWDDRDRDQASRSGARHSVSLTSFFPLLGANYRFSRITVDLRQYFNLLPGHVLAAQLYARRVAGSVPFQLLASLAGEGRMRGFVRSRYVDRTTASGQMEYRAHLFWRLGVVAFLGLGDVAPTFGNFRLARLRYAGGGGLRFALNQKDGVNLRIDGGVTSEGHQNGYILVGEAF